MAARHRLQYCRILTSSRVGKQKRSGRSTYCPLGTAAQPHRRRRRMWKTTMLEEVICPTYETFFECTARATPSNKSARLFKAKTMHALSGFRPSDSLRTVNIRIRTDTMRKRTQAVHVKCGALFIDEYSQLPTPLYHANNLLWTIARQSRYNLKLEDYHRPRETTGRISKCILS